MTKRNVFSIASLIILFFAFVFVLFSCGNNGAKIDSPTYLTVCEGLEKPIGLHDNKPTFSWKLPVNENIKSQSAYRIVVASDTALLPNKADLWDSGEVDSEQSVWVKYKGKFLESRQKAYWQVMFRDQSGKESAWSKLSNFELGLLSNNDWKAKWIALEPEARPDRSEKGLIIHRPEYLRKNFTLKSTVREARLYISAKGLFEAQINGKKVGNDVLVPGFTPYKKRIETLSYDVSKYINNKTNTIGIILGEGWYSGRLAWAKDLWPPKPRPKAICQLEITYDNGEKEIIISDDNWRGTRNGPIRFSGIYDGEVYDANLEIADWSTPNFNDTNWENVKSSNLDSSIQLVPKSHLAVTNKEELPTLAITNVGSGRFIFDLGQNMVGVPLIKMPVIKDQTVTIRFAEMLNQDGTLYTDNYRNAKSIDYYTPKANAETSYLPKFTFHGFRYVELSGFDASKQPDKSWVTGIVQYSDFEATGTFSSSHDKLNKLQKNISWGLKGNLVDIPTDCPQRDERLGWTGDAQVITPTSIFNNRMHAFWASWLKSMREEQGKSGNIPVVIPNVLFDHRKGDISSRFYTSSGWSDAATIVPWEVYFRTGDTKILRDNYEMMKGLLDFYKSMSSNHIVEMFTFGDWLQPHRENNGSSSDTKPELINTAYYARSIDITMKTAEVLGNKKDANNLKVLRDSVRVAFETEFIDDEGKLTTEYETQTGYLMALGFDLVTEETAQKILPHLIRKIKDADNHLRTGFLGTPLLATVLSKYNRADLMYTLLFKETYPSWFFSINQGATTMWERWNSYSHKDGFGDAGMNSFNHYAYGAIGQFMYECIAGINPLEPGYKKILIAPMPGEMLEHAKAEYNSLYGKISSAWKKIDNGLELDVTIPPNTSGKIVIPIREGQSVTLDNKEIANNTDVKVIEKNDTNIVLAVMPGSYEFIAN